MIPLYSIAKPFLAQAVLEIGVSIEHPIGKFLPDLAAIYASRTIETLLNHTSGLGSYGELPDYQVSVDAKLPVWPTELLLEKCCNIAHDKVGFSYSNLGYLLLIKLVERETGLRYFKALEHLVFNPLGISDFVEWNQANEVVPNYDPGWVYSGTFLSRPEAIAPNITKLAQHRASTLGHKAGLIRVDFADTGFDSPGYNFGFMTDGGFDSAEPKYVGHGGSGPGYELMVLVNTETWQSALEYTENGFVQSEAITRLRGSLGS